MILLIDNYDSFVHNLARYFERLGQSTLVVRNDEIDVPQIRKLAPRGIVLSPGPRTPREAGCSLDVVARLHQDVPLLGVCLGHQVIAEALGGRVVRATTPVHGRATSVRHDGEGVFHNVPSPFSASRYHSLVVDSLPDCLKVQARSDDGSVMALCHRDYPVVGWQFHPESILTEPGSGLLAAFLRLAGIDPAAQSFDIQTERAAAKSPDHDVPHVPITF